MPPLSTPEQRRRAVALVVALTANTHLAPQRYEKQLLLRFEQGELTLDQVENLLAASIHQVLYHSRSVGRPTQAELNALLAWSQPYNAANDITGLLLYSDGCYVQLLEGAKEAVEALYAAIRRDSRHTQVETLSQGPAPCRFTDWSMAFGYVTPAQQLEQAIRAVQSQTSTAALSDPKLRALVQAFL